MAAETLFNEDYETLLKRVRIESAKDEQTQELVAMSVSEARIGFYKALTSARVNAILAMDLVDNPSTDDEILRKHAANIEVLWVTFLLMERLPNLFMSSGHLVNQVFNEEPLTRDADPAQKAIESLKQQVDDGLADLVEVPEDYQSKSFQAFSVGPDEDVLIADTFPACSDTGNGWATVI